VSMIGGYQLFYCCSLAFVQFSLVLGTLLFSNVLVKAKIRSMLLQQLSAIRRALSGSKSSGSNLVAVSCNNDVVVVAKAMPGSANGNCGGNNSGGSGAIGSGGDRKWCRMAPVAAVDGTTVGGSGCGGGGNWQ
jgi:hypothetical protein